MANTINSRTVAGLLEFCDYLIQKGYAGESAIRPWKIAIRQVFETLEAADDASLDVTTLDLGDFLGRFEVKARGQYTHGSMQAYTRRVRKAIDAYGHFLDTGRPPTLKRAPARPTKSETDASPNATTATVKTLPARPQNGNGNSSTGTNLIDFPFPLRSGQMAHLHLPAQLARGDADRLSAFLRTLQMEDQHSLPPGEEQAA